MNTNTQAAIALLERLIATPSISRDEGEAANIMEDFLRKNGCQPHRKGHNVWATSSHWRDDRPTLLLNAHIDTVKPVAGWTRDPFSPTFEGDCLYGLGANDCGGGLVSLAQTFLTYEHEAAALPLACNLIYLASCEEEVSGVNGIASVLPDLPPIAFALVGEPTGLQPAVAEKGLMVIDATAHGRAGHAAREEGDNAIYHALDDIRILREGGLFPKVSPLLGAVKTTATVINGGTQHNVIPDQCTFIIDVRTNELYSNEEALSILQSHLSSHLQARRTTLCSSGLPADHPFVQACVRLGLQPFGSPTLSDQALMRFPSAKLGPGQSARSHTADEYIRVEEIEEAIFLYEKLLTMLYGENK